MVLPLRVDNIQNDSPLEPAHHLLAEQFFLFGVAFLDAFDESVAQFRVIHFARVDSGDLHINAVLVLHLGGKLRDVPFFRMLVCRAKCIHEFAGNVFRDA